MIADGDVRDAASHRVDPPGDVIPDAARQVPSHEPAAQGPVGRVQPDRGHPHANTSPRGLAPLAVVVQALTVAVPLLIANRPIADNEPRSLPSLGRCKSAHMRRPPPSWTPSLTHSSNAAPRHRRRGSRRRLPWRPLSMPTANGPAIPPSTSAPPSLRRPTRYSCSAGLERLDDQERRPREADGAGRRHYLRCARIETRPGRWAASTRCTA